MDIHFREAIFFAAFAIFSLRPAAMLVSAGKSKASDR
jgi:hypothetical protein